MSQPAPPSSPSPLFIGLDAGGSKTELLATDGRQPPWRGTGPAAQLQRHGPEEAARRLAGLVNEARDAFPGSPLGGVCAGVAGAGRPAEQEALRLAMRPLLGDDGPAHFFVTHDGLIALEGAFVGESGLIVIAGTGSLVLGRTAEGAVRRVGGWGYLLGDEGSGHALGLRALRALAAFFDGGPGAPLLTRLVDTFGVATPEALIHQVYREGWSPAQAAPCVIAAAAEGDPMARSFIWDEAHALARQAARLVAHGGDFTPQLALIGGLATEPLYAEALGEALTTALPGWRVAAPQGRPVDGALRLAYPPGEKESARPDPGAGAYLFEN